MFGNGSLLVEWFRFSGLSSRFEGVHTSAAATARRRRHCSEVLACHHSLCDWQGDVHSWLAVWGRPVGAFGE